MDPCPVGPQQQIALESKAGVAGHGAFATGVRSNVQQITTVRDFTSFSNAVAGKAVYEGAVGTVLSITYGGVVLGFSALILGVEATVEAVVGAVGGLSGSPAAIVTARWTIETRA
jgi:hypothetical protein